MNIYDLEALQILPLLNYLQTVKFLVIQLEYFMTKNGSKMTDFSRFCRNFSNFADVSKNVSKFLTKNLCKIKVCSIADKSAKFHEYLTKIS